MIVITIILFVYCLLVVGLIAGWRKSVRKAHAPHPVGMMVTVVVPVRNEEKNIATLLHDVSLQDYPNFEVIVADDHSEDGTKDVVRNFSLPQLRYIKSVGHGKKQAITTAVACAQGEVIVTTDADCSLSSGWLTQMVSPFSNPSVRMVFGGVKMKTDGSFFSVLQAMEFTSLIGTAVATAAWGIPVMCNGANLAFRKKAFFDVQGYEGNLHIASGDDEFLMRKIHARFPDGLRFVHSTGSVVSTRPLSSLGDFLEQRIRWASKWKQHTSLFSSILAVFIFLVQVLSLTGWMQLGMSFYAPLLVVMFLKLVLEARFLKTTATALAVPWNGWAFLVLQLVYPLYVALVAVMSLFASYSWKGRKLR